MEAGRLSRWIAAALVTLALALLASPAASAQDHATTALDVVPSGQFQTPGPEASRQAEMYNALTPLRDNVSDLDLPRFFKPEPLGPANVVRTETIPDRPGVEIRRDEFDVPHVYGQTDDDVIFAAGWLAGKDQNLLYNQGRFVGRLAAIDAPNISAIDLIAGLYQFEPSKQTERIVARQAGEILKAGGKGRQLLRHIDTYLAGINAWYAANQPSQPRYTRNDIYAFSAIKGQFLGEGGGKEARHGEFLDGLQKRFGSGDGFDVFEDLRGRVDPDTTTTLRNAAPYNPLPSSHKGTVGLRNGSYEPTGPKLPTALGARVPSNKASNVLVASGQRSATGRPLFVGGPQINYFFPGLVSEISLHGPSIDARGVTAPPFPGYMLIGRTADFAWTLTSAEGDIVDSFAETLCGRSRTKYEFDGKCRAMEKVEAGTIVKGDDRTKVTFYRTVHGSVIGYAKTRGGKTVAIARKRSSYGRDTVDQLVFQDLTFGRIKSFAGFAKAASQTPQTFNAFYADATTAGMYTTGALPTRPNGADGDLPTDGRGTFEWTGYLAASKHPQGTVPNGVLVNWNNKPAPKFAASDTRFGDETMFTRDDMLVAELQRTLVHTLGSVVGAMNAAATEDVRGRIFWPVLKAVLDKGGSPSALATSAVAQIDAWAQNRAPRLDVDGDGNLDDAGVAIMDGGWKRIADAAMCPTLGTKLCNQLATQQPRFESPNDRDNQYSGWYHYMAKDLSTLLGLPVKQEYSRGYCGGGNLKRCSAALWRAIDQTASELAAEQGPDPAAWRESAAPQTIHFRPLDLIPIAYTNRPSGIQQVISFG